MTERSSTATAPGLSEAGQELAPRLRTRSRGRALLSQLQQLLMVVVLAAGSYFLISRFILQSVTVVGMSMSPTLSNSERYLLNRWVFHIRAPRRGDIVVIRDPADNGFSVKRIVGVAGETVSVKEGSVFVNGHPLAESYLMAGTRTFADSIAAQTFHCGPTHYFLLGDNRGNSVDSRSYGPVPRQNILGLVVR